MTTTEDRTAEIRTKILRAVDQLGVDGLLCPDCGVGSISLGDELATWLRVAAHTYEATALRVGPLQVAEQIIQWAEAK